MDKNKDKAPKAEKETKQEAAPEIVDNLEEVADDTQENDTEQTLAKELEATQAALEKEKKEYLFLMAEFDNFRKRTIKEKSELIKNAAEAVLKALKKAKFMICEINPITYYRFNLNTYLITNIGAKVQKTFDFRRRRGQIIGRLA